MSLYAFIAGMFSSLIFCQTAASLQDERDDKFVGPMKGSIKLIDESSDVRIHVSKNTMRRFEVNQRLFVYRDGFSIGTLTVKEPTESGCIATIEHKFENMYVKNGDKATLDRTINWIRTLDMTEEFDAKELATEFAEADLKFGLRRILYYGQPRAVDSDDYQALKDSETELPMHVAAGCIVSMNFVEFVNEYNRIVREDFANRN